MEGRGGSSDRGSFLTGSPDRGVFLTGVYLGVVQSVVQIYLAFGTFVVHNVVHEADCTTDQDVGCTT
jgi:hypothetical protein